MYVNGRGMGALQCPGDPGCNVASNWTQPDPGSVQYQLNQLWDRFNESSTPAIDPTVIDEDMSHQKPSGIETLLTGKNLVIAGASLFGLVLLMKAGR